MTLDYLDFDYSEDDEGTGCWDAMASVPAARVPTLAAEVEQLLAWAHRRFKGRRGPIEEGGDWDYDLHASLETVAALELDYDPAARRLACQATSDGLPRYTLTLTLGGTAGFALALRERFDLGDD